MKPIISRIHVGRWLCLGTLFHLGCSLATAALVNVDIQPTAFSPADITILENDQVQWTWVSDFHSTTSQMSLWDSGVHNTGFLYTNAFPNAGYFPYYCTVHGFVGSVTVEAPNVATNVAIEPTAFDPSNVTVQVNDVVQWTWVSDFHTTTSDTALWDSGVHNTGFAFTNAFPTPGNYPYSCVVHGFTGSITVQAPPLITNVDIQPLAFSPAQVTIHVNDKVQWTWVSNFHSTTSDTALWDSGVHNTGFLYTNTFATAGNFPYHCVVHGFVGSVTVLSVSAPPPLLSAPQFIPPSTFEFNYSAGFGLNYVVQRSSDLNLWVPLTTNQAASSSVMFQDTNASAATLFYRVFQLPGQ